MRIQYLAHASFLITTSAGTRIVTDPFDPQAYPDAMTYSAFDGAADIVTISHEHADHSNSRMVKGSPIIIKGCGKFAACEVEFRGVGTDHDAEHGAKRGKNTVFVITTDGLRVVHLGDLGHVLNADQAAEIGDVDVALVPVGGYFTIDAAQAQKVVDRLNANLVIPMHYRTEKCSFPIAKVDDFLEGKDNITRKESSILDVSKQSLPSDQQIIVLEHSL